MDGPEIVALYDAHARDLVGYFAWRTRDPHVALDLVADTFAAAFAQRDRCRAASEPERVAWLYRIASNELADHFRKHAIERRALSQLGWNLRALSESEYERIEALAASSALRERVSAALARLSSDQQEAVRLRVVEERSYTEVAGTLGVSEQTARARVSRGLRALRRVAARDERGTR